jgi:hypothetical protein
MPEGLAEILVTVVQLYGASGVLFAAPFVTAGVNAIDPLARTAPWSFRLLIVPGVILWWPLLAYRWAAGAIAPPTEVNAHRRLARRTS